MPKRVGNLMPLICSLANLHESYLRVVRGKEGKKAAIDFRQDTDGNLLRIGRQLMDGTFDYSDRHSFTLFDPKERFITGPSFPMAVAFQAIMRICHPVFDDYQTNFSFASRPGYGTYKALEMAQRMAKEYEWFAIKDMVKFFYSLNHEVMLRQLCRLFKDPLLLMHFQMIIRSYDSRLVKGVPERIKSYVSSIDTGLGIGGPIGYLPMQYLANHYLGVADHWAKERLGMEGMVRYMDDVVLFGHDKKTLLRKVRDYTNYVGDELHLMTHEPVINRTKYGIPYLGYVVYKDHLRLNKRSQERFLEKMLALACGLREGRITEREYAAKASCLLAFVAKADSVDFRLKLATDYKGIYPEWDLAV